ITPPKLSSKNVALGLPAKALENSLPYLRSNFLTDATTCQCEQFFNTASIVCRRTSWDWSDLAESKESIIKTPRFTICHCINTSAKLCSNPSSSSLNLAGDEQSSVSSAITTTSWPFKARSLARLNSSADFPTPGSPMTRKERD